MAQKPFTGNTSNKSGVSGGAIAGIVVGSLLVVLVAGGGVVVWKRKTPVSSSGKDDDGVGFENQTYHFDTSKEEMSSINKSGKDREFGLNLETIDASDT